MNQLIISIISLLIFVVSMHGHPPSFATFPLENSVLAEPRVDCGVETISVWIRTERPFRGRLYIEDESENPECVHSYAKEGRPIRLGGPQQPHQYSDDLINDSRGAEFSIRFGKCNMRRQRLLNPRGVAYSFTLIISFHPIFLTGIDRAFNIKCFFMEAVKALDTALDVSSLATTVVEREFTLPQCAYHLKHGVDGPFMKYATIGEPITHVWQCDPVAGWLYGVLIHSCFVDDGHGNRFDLIDERGCIIDRTLLAEIIYDEKSFTAYAHTHVFRYADRVQLFFTCTVQLCFREDGGCEGISPPHCLDSHHGLHQNKAPIPSGFKRHFRPGGPSQAHHGSAPSPFSRRFPFKDSPLLPTNNNIKNESEADQLLSEIFLNSNRSRAGRNADGIMTQQMEADLNTDLTVVPRRMSTKEENDVDDKIDDRVDNQQRLQMEFSGKNPFVRVLPIKSDEYGAGPLLLSSSLESQRLGSFEVLAIAGGIFIALITVTSLITSFCQHCRLCDLIPNKIGLLERRIIIG